MRTHVSFFPQITANGFLLWAVIVANGLLNIPAAVFAQKPKPVTPNLKFDQVGPQVGDELPDLRLRTMKGEVQRLSDAWNGGPALLITSSLTCPKSRSRWPELKAISDKYGEKLNIVILYVIEAHPVGSICPYKDVEDITPENERDGILRRQPATLEDRMELAQEFKRLLRIGVPIYVDNLKNEVWKAVGGAPNLALLVDKEGIVVAREGWFEGKAVEKAIEQKLAGLIKNDDREKEREEDDNQGNGYVLLEKAGLEPYDVRDAVQDKDAKKLSQLVTKHPALVKYVFPSDQGHHNETTILMEAVEHANLAAVKLLLDRGADVHAATSSYSSALQLAAQKGDVEIVKLLLKHKANPAFPKTGKTPLHEAMIAGHRAVGELFITAGVPADFYSEIALGNATGVRKILAADSSWALRPDGAQRMPLDYAAANGQREIAAILLDHGAPVIQDKTVREVPPLHFAIRRKDSAMVELLLKAGSSPDIATSRGGEDPDSTPALHLAVEAKSVDVMKLLLAFSPNLNARNTYSKTALHVAARQDQAEMVSLLIKAGADVNAPQLGYSLPCGSGRENIPSNNTPLHYAAALGSPAVIKALLAGGAKLEARNREGNTPLMATVRPPQYSGLPAPKLENIRTLIAAGADMNARDEEGQTILDLVTMERASRDAEAEKGAKREDFSELTVLLQKHGAKAGVRKEKPTPQEDDTKDPFAL